jgi:hypothetical protein
MFLIKSFIFICYLKLISSYKRVSPVFSFNNTISCGSTKYYNKFPTDCGISQVKPTINGQILNTRLINGEDSRKLSWPWLVYLAEKTNQIKFKCSASLINNQYVLTLASCIHQVNRTNLVAIIGLDETNNVPESNYVYNIKDVINYKQFDENDIYSTANLALIKLARVVDISGIKPICLPNSDDSSKIFGKRIVVTSW